MSYGGGGYRRKHHYRDDVEHHVHETLEQKIKSSILKLGEVDPLQELPRLSAHICAQKSTITSTVVEALRIGVTQQPYKIPYYATLLRLLSTTSVSEETTLQGQELGKQMLEDFWKGFQGFLDRLAWREIRHCVHFFAHLAVAQVISAASLYNLISAFVAVLDEFGVSHGRAKQAVRCAIEGLMIAGPALAAESSADITSIVTAIKSYVQSVSRFKYLVRPITGHLADDGSHNVANELLDSALTALEVMYEDGFAQGSECFPRPYVEVITEGSVVFALPSVLVPPEVIELDGLSSESDILVKKADWAEFHIRIFDNDVTPDPNTPSGYAVRCGLLDLVDIFEVNRKECARLLLEFPKWTIPGTFQHAQDPVSDKNWQLECTILEVTCQTSVRIASPLKPSVQSILGQFLLLPESTHKSVYFITLITELCKLAPSTVGPAVGKSIRKMYNLLSEGLDVALADRLAIWFSTHMSNFNFIWVWKEWIGDLGLSIQHPKRVFMRRAVEYEIRLSYYDRIVKTLPEQMQSREACVLPEEAPRPIFAYDDPASPYHDIAQSVLNLLSGRAKAEDVMAHLEELKNTFETTDTDGNINTTIRAIAVQSLLHIGSRSISHYLNAIERYLPLLRNLAGGGISSGRGSNTEARSDILSAVLAFWKQNNQGVIIALDKLMQYQIVDPTDVITWSFVHAGPKNGEYRTCTAFQWDLIKGALDKANGRVVIAHRRLATLRKEDDDNAARAKASHGGMDIEDAKPDPVVESPALASAVKALASLTREQEAALTQTVDGFFRCLVTPGTSSPATRDVITTTVWDNRNSWAEAEWLSWETWAWYIHLCRTYAPYLRNYASTLEANVFADSKVLDDPAGELFKKIWSSMLD
ncbi:MIF4G like-domain-containing protein [Cristinia sonorae]|uniref:MIF4G like-domain-containing protein n=1 Tax=Cristinia sonorae TaxID=1940300 RepID=A0A8K0UF34_9AGAR|nr:MIF4G like-domain-containing protein [Cristinia sonorae]